MLCCPSLTEQQGTSGAAEKISAGLEVLSVDAKKTKPSGPKRFIRQAVR
jgi:hypothetical protein